MTTKKECTLPPPGWYCGRGDGHEGPCAAHPDKRLLTHGIAEALLDTGFLTTEIHGGPFEEGEYVRICEAIWRVLVQHGIADSRSVVHVATEEHSTHCHRCGVLMGGFAIIDERTGEQIKAVCFECETL